MATVVGMAVGWGDTAWQGFRVKMLYDSPSHSESALGDAARPTPQSKKEIKSLETGFCKLGAGFNSYNIF